MKMKRELKRKMEMILDTIISNNVFISIISTAITRA